jgi:hypothetical protein
MQCNTEVKLFTKPPIFIPDIIGIKGNLHASLWLQAKERLLDCGLYHPFSNSKSSAAYLHYRFCPEDIELQPALNPANTFLYAGRIHHGRLPFGKAGLPDFVYSPGKRSLTCVHPETRMDTLIYPIAMGVYAHP